MVASRQKTGYRLAITKSQNAAGRMDDTKLQPKALASGLKE